MIKHAEAFKIDLTAIDRYGDTGYQLAEYMVEFYGNDHQSLKIKQ